jgi:hypothetical protein
MKRDRHISRGAAEHLNVDVSPLWGCVILVALILRHGLQIFRRSAAFPDRLEGAIEILSQQKSS